MPLPRVLIVGPLPPPNGGMANQTLQLQRLLATEGLQATVVNTQAPYRPAWAARLRGVRAVFRLLPYLLSLWRGTGKADVVHVMANSGWSWYLFAAPAVHIAHWRGCGVIVNYRGGLAREFLQRHAHRVGRTLRHARLVVPSAFLQQVFGEFGLAAQVIPNVVDVDRFHPGEGSRTGVTGTHVVIARALERIYGVDLALEATALLREQFPGLRVSIAGEGPDREALQSLARTLDLGDAVRFTGRLAPDEMASLLRDADLVLNPVRADNTPNSVLEALACGVPVVSTRVGGVPFLVEHGRSAWLVQPESPAALAEGVRIVLSDLALRGRLIAHGRDLARGFSWPVVRDQWLGSYEASARAQ